jgi:hypothetical protein
MTDSEFNREWMAATRIIDHALADAIDEAIEAKISAECFMAAALYHTCTVLIDGFEQTPDDVGLLAQKSASVYVAKGAATAAKH